MALTGKQLRESETRARILLKYSVSQAVGQAIGLAFILWLQKRRKANQ